MKTEWDYTKLASAYLKRPDYSDAAIDAMLSIAGAKKKDRFCDIGAGAAHLTLLLAAREVDVVAVEPNDSMRAYGIERTKDYTNVKWHEGTGENTGQTDTDIAMVTFGSSFNVCNRQLALVETARILKPRGWFACMWNHRDLNDPIQSNIESIIKNIVSSYDYGIRREDQTPEIDKSNLFGPVVHLNARVMHTNTIKECVEAWRSHATLQRQAGTDFSKVISKIEDYLLGLGQNIIEIPYSTNIWVSRLK